MEKIFKSLSSIICVLALFSCCSDSDPEPSPNPPVDISDKIIGEWVYESLKDSAWQSMKFTESGVYFYSEQKDEWSLVLSKPGGRYYLEGMNVSAASASGVTYVDMTIQTIDNYSFTARHKNTDLDLTFNKVLMRFHLNIEESVIPPYSELIDKPVISYKSHDEKIAIVDAATGEITAKAENGRTYIDVTTSEGTACIKVMIGNVNDGDLTEISTIPTKRSVSISIDDISSIVGPLWVYDHPEEMVWEIIRFGKTGEVGYSNEVKNWIIESEASGEYTIDQKTIKGYINLGGTPMDFHWVVTALTDYEFTVKAFSSGQYVGKFTYSKQLDAIDLTIGDTTVPDYQQYMGDAKINGYKSHNDELLSVNSETGELTAIAGGQTYVDVITEQGTAVLMVSINKPKQFFAMNYEEYLGVNWIVIGTDFGTGFTKIDNVLYYDYSEGSINDRQNTILDDNWSSLSFVFDSDPYAGGQVKGIQLCAKTDVWFTAEEMNQYLKEHYYVYEKGTESDYKAFINNEEYDQATVGITWDMTNKILMFVKITHQPVAVALVYDYGRYMGKTRDEAKEMMTSELGVNPSSETEKSLIYMLNNDNIQMIVLSFDGKETIQGIQVRLAGNVDKDAVNEELGKQYTLFDFANETFYYTSEDAKMRIYYLLSYNMIKYEWKK